MVQIWELANSTANADLIDVCAPGIMANLEDPKTSGSILSSIEACGLIGLLTSPYVEGVAAEDKVKLVAAWMNSSTDELALANRVEHFEFILQALDLRSLSPVFMIDIASGETDCGLSKACKKKLIQAWKKEQLSTHSLAFTTLTTMSCIPR